MARVSASRNEKIYKINKWLGVNENPDSDTNMRLGEASAMTNFRITNDHLLQIRPGTQNVANLLFDCAIDVSSTLTALLTETITTTASYTCYPNISVTDGGLFTLSGTPVTVTYANVGTYADYYYKDPNGVVYKVGGCVYDSGIVGGVQQYRWNKWNCNTSQVANYSYNTVLSDSGSNMNGGWTVETSGYWSGSTPVTQGPTKVINAANPGTGYSASGATLYIFSYAANGSYTVYAQTYAGIYYTTSYTKGSVSYGYVTGATSAYPTDGKQLDGSTYYWYDGKVQNTTYTWSFYRVSIVPNTEDNVVRGVWSGRVGGNEVILAACNGYLWELSETGGVWTRTRIQTTYSTDGPVHIFGFDGNAYLLNGDAYMKWDGTNLTTVAGYRPLTFTETVPTGGGNAKERINMLNGLRRVRFSPNGSATVYQLQEKGLTSIDYVKNLVTGANYTLTTQYTVNTTNGTVTFVTAPATGIDTVEIGYTYPTTLRASIEAMTLSETYNGVSDNRVFIYGDKTNKAYYSGLDYNGTPTAEYFPDLNVINVGDANTPLTSMVRHYDRLLAFKEDSAYSIRYDTITLVDGVVTAGFYCTTVNKGIGCAGYGQAIIVENQPRTLDGQSIYEWQATTSSGNITGDQRNAKRISQKVEMTIKSLDLTTAVNFFDKINHESFVVQNGIALVQNTETGAWYVYRDFPALCMIVYKDELFYGTADGYIRHVSRDYMHDCGAPITAYWEGGSMDFGADYMRKYSDTLYVGIKPESKGKIKVTVQTDKQTTYDDPDVIANYTGEVDSGFFSWLDLDFEHFSFNVNDKPQMQRLRIKVKNFAYYKLIFSSVSDSTTATITSADIKVRYVGNVR